MRKNILFFLLISLVTILFLSCGAPFYYERAEIKKGVSGGIGLGVGTGDGVSHDPDEAFDFPAIDYYLGGIGTIYARYGLSDKVSLFIQGSFATGTWLTENWRNASEPRSRALTGEVQIGMKFRVGEKGALRVSAGMPSLVDLVYLHDFNDFVTANAGIGFRGLGLGLALHPQISDRLLGHISLNIIGSPVQVFSAFQISASIGFGIEVINTSDWGFGRVLLGFGIAALSYGLPMGAASLLALPVTPACAATATYFYGKRCYNETQRGSFWWTLGGAYTGALPPIGVCLATNNEWWLVSSIPISALGAVLGYQLSRPKSYSPAFDQGFFHPTFDPPSFSLKSEKDRKGKTAIAFDFRLINARF